MVHITWFDLRPTHKAPVELALSASSHGQKQTSLPLILMKRENRWSRQKSKMKCAAIYSQWLSDCNRSQCHLSVSYLSYNDKPNSWWTNAQTGQRYSTEGTSWISPINQRTINSDRKGTRDLAKSRACYCDAWCPQHFQLNTWKKQMYKQKRLFVNRLWNCLNVT